MDNKNNDRTARCSRIARRLLLANGFNMQHKGARALWFCGTLAAAQGLPRRMVDCCRMYAEYTGSNVWLVHKNMANACAASGCGCTPWALLQKMEQLGVYV